MNLETSWSWLIDNWSAWRLPIGGLLAVLLLLLMWRRIRRSGVSTVAASIATPLVLIWEAQGIYALATSMGVPPAASIVLSGVTGAVLVTLASRAHEHYGRHGILGPNARLVWAVAVPMGIVVALSAHSLSEAALRIILPLLAATVWWSRYLPDEPEGRTVQRRGTWRWTPRRIGVTLGLLDPTDADLSQVHAERQIRRLTATAHKLHHGWAWVRRARASRLRRLGLLATPEMIAEVQRRISLVNQITELTAPAPGVLTPDEPTPEPKRTPAGDDKPKPRKATTPTAGRNPSTPERVAKILKRRPDATTAQIAVQLGLSERTIQRNWPRRDDVIETTREAALSSADLVGAAA